MKTPLIALARTVRGKPIASAAVIMYALPAWTAKAKAFTRAEPSHCGHQLQVWRFYEDIP
jgi:hypothetical protein